jgi:tetratricopeptide (TPR) repeat protein
MRQVATDYTHVAVTDHRIPRTPDLSKAEPQGWKELQAWAEPPAQFRTRDLAIAYLTAGGHRNSTDITRTGLRLFEALPPPQRDSDASLMTNACDALMRLGEPKKAAEFCAKAAALSPGSADRAMAYGTALSKAGDLVHAERQLKAATRLDPSLKHAYVELWTLYDKQQRLEDMAQIANEYLRWNPQNVMFRVLKAAVGKP